MRQENNYTYKKKKRNCVRHTGSENKHKKAASGIYIRKTKKRQIKREKPHQKRKKSA